VTRRVLSSALVPAAVDRVWELVAAPEGIGRWAGGSLLSAEPEGPAAAGQRLHLLTSAFGLLLPVTIEVREADATRCRLRLVVDLPFGVAGDETIELADAGGGRTLVRLGSDLHFPPGWRGRAVLVLLARRWRRGPAASLRRLRRAAEAGR